MPTYDYRCTACKHEFEQFQSMKDKPLRKCPKCGKNALDRLIGTGAAIVFKGSGFYQTDYRSENYKKAAESDKPANDSGATKTESASTDSKAATPAADPKPSKAESAEKSGKKSKASKPKAD
ncbi:MAG: zinc ribbon domain-containing protein [Phycisphaerales bacterium]|nr:MAG: zinc ribbon domain-containing protein [Phycisphaerales bacterium]